MATFGMFVLAKYRKSFIDSVVFVILISRGDVCCVAPMVGWYTPLVTTPPQGQYNFT